MKPFEPCFLIASPDLRDENFAETVVFLMEHNKEGSFGLIVNRPTPYTVGDIWKELTQKEYPIEDPIYLGGPVEGPLMALHARPLHSEREILPGLFWTTQKHDLESLVETYEPPLLLFNGYSGWGTGQLDHEVAQGSWLFAPAQKDLLFDSKRDLWKRLIAGVGESFMRNLSRVQTLPHDTSSN
jgi:putative transcriptional regulator